MINPSYFQDDQAPVETVTWDQAKYYCSLVQGRLPTEAEWEYAARAGSKEARYGPIDAIAWYADNSGNTRINSEMLWKRDPSHYFPTLKANGNRTRPVGQKKPNAWGLYDMLGNIYEWVADWYDSDYYKDSPLKNPKGPLSGQSRVIRGGSWFDLARNLRLSHRYRNDPIYNVNYFHGFRCARDVSP